jgi:protein-S-isoprenylcysteine O-methyltransferase Ste14
MLIAARAAVMLSWFAVFGGWVLQWWHARHGRSDAGRKVNRASVAGMLLELTSFVILVLWREPVPVYPGVVYVGASLLAISSAVLGWVAGLHLGAQLRVQAVVTSEHRLVTSGPYSVVRHPIYACLFGFLIATGLVFSRPLALVAALPVFVLGTEIRLRAEDRLLAEHFGEEFQAYRRRVSAWLPGLR